MTPITGVISSHNVAWEFVDNEICLSCEEFYRELDEIQDCPECENLLDEVGYCGECGWEKQHEIDMLECDDHEKLIGDWDFDTKTQKYSPNANGEFAAIVTDSSFNCVQVVWSKYTTNVRTMCSPCFPGQADLDSGEGNILAYTLPDYLLEKE